MVSEPSFLDLTSATATLSFSPSLNIYCNQRNPLGSEIYDFEFNPCGYSMNSIEGSAISTIHVTTEDGLGYTSFEDIGYNPKDVNLDMLVKRVLASFCPGEFSVSLHADANQPLDHAKCLDIIGYQQGKSTLKKLCLDRSIMYQKFVKATGVGSPRSTLTHCWKEEE